jgi:hypothetical protein
MELMVAVKEEWTTEKCSSKEEFPPAEEGTTKKSFRPSRRRVAHPRAIVFESRGMELFHSSGEVLCVYRFPNFTV